MALTIQEGRYYLRRDGNKVGPAQGRGSYYYLNGAGHYTPDGKYSYRGRMPRDSGDAALADIFDLVSEWADPAASPVRKVTRREIVPGTYGIVHVATAPGQAAVWIENKFRNPEELRDAASVLNAIADALSSPALTDPNNEQ